MGHNLLQARTPCPPLPCPQTPKPGVSVCASRRERRRMSPISITYINRAKSPKMYHFYWSWPLGKDNGPVITLATPASPQMGLWQKVPSPVGKEAHHLQGCLDRGQCRARCKHSPGRKHWLPTTQRLHPSHTQISERLQHSPAYSL